MKQRIYSKEFVLSMMRAFPGKGGALKIAASSWRAYYCTECQSAGCEILIAQDYAGWSATRHARLAVYEHFRLHEQPALSFREMEDFGRRAWLGRKLGYESPPEGKSLEELQALISLVHGGGMKR